MRYLLLFILVFNSAVIANAQAPPEDYRIYSTSLKKEVTIAELVEQLQPGQVLVFGEQHDDSIGHLLEADIFNALYKRFNKDLVLAMEMFQRDVQYIIDEYLAGQISEKNFIKESRAWDTYKNDYRSLIEFAKDKNLKVVAANAPSRYTNLVTRKGLTALGGLSKHVKKEFIAPLPIDTLTGPYFERFMETMGGHTMPGMHLYQSQNFWDATMSWSVNQAMRANKGGVVFMVNGRFHSDFYSGMVHRLKHDYKRSVRTISCFANENLKDPDWKTIEGLADFVILTKPSSGTQVVR